MEEASRIRNSVENPSAEMADVGGLQVESWRWRLLPPPPPPPAAAHISTPLPMCIPCLPICLIGVCLSFRETTDGYMWSSGGISFVARDLLLAWVLKQLHERRQRPSTSFDFPSFTLLPSCLATTTTTTTGWTPPPLLGCLVVDRCVELSWTLWLENLSWIFAQGMMGVTFYVLWA